jgi:hypothetical protein
VVDIRVMGDAAEVANTSRSLGPILSSRARAGGVTRSASCAIIRREGGAWWRGRGRSDVRRRLGFLDEAIEELVDVGEDEDGQEWVVRRVLGYGRAAMTGAGPIA